MTGITEVKNQRFGATLSGSKTLVYSAMAELQEKLLKRIDARTNREDITEEIYRLREDNQKTQPESAE